MDTIVNAKGVPLFYSGVSTKHISATNSGRELYGTSANDTFWGDGSVYVTMHGGAGDDIYHLYSSINNVAEEPGEGIDTVVTWMSYTLPDDVENLTVTDNGRYAFGNALDNIIQGGAGRQTLDGGMGDDVLIGGGGSNIFVVSKGNGSDLIVDFEAADTVRLNGYGLTSFESVQAYMAQTGLDVQLDLGSDEILVFKDTTIEKFAPGQFELPMDKSARLKLTITELATGMSSVPPRRLGNKLHAVDAHDDGQDKHFGLVKPLCRFRRLQRRGSPL